MARGITEQDVFGAADRLLTRGERPTIERVRLELGRGSPNTVNRLLDVWWSSLSKRMGGSDDGGLPASIVQVCRSLYGEMRQQADLAATSAIEETQRVALRERQELERAQSALAAEKAGVVAMVAALKDELAALNTRNRQISEHANDLENQLAVERRRADEATVAARLANDERERTSAALKAEVEKIRTQWQGNENHWLSEINHLRDDAKRLRTEHERQLKSLQTRIVELEGVNSVSAKSAAALAASIRSLEAKLSKERENRSAAEAVVAANRTMLKRLQNGLLKTSKERRSA